MMFLLLPLALYAVSATPSGQINIEYDAPTLKLTLTVNKDDISKIVFHYFINDLHFQGRGVFTTDGWQYQSPDVTAGRAATVKAYAFIFDSSGNILETTQTTMLNIGQQGAFQLPSPRRIRAVVFRDDFNSLNRAHWSIEVSMYGGFNGEFQVYTNDHKNVYVKDGHLYLQPIATVSDPRFNENFLHTGHMDMKTLFGECTEAGENGCTRDGHNGILPPVMSGKVNSIPTLRFGTIEIRARIPRGDWLWPSLWMMPRSSHYGYWPRSGEIDIMEARGNLAGNIGVAEVSSTLHWGTSPTQDHYRSTTAEKKSTNWHTNYHIWRLEWTHDHIITFIDDQQIMSVAPPAGGFWQKGGFTGSNIWSTGSKMAPFDQDFYLMFNVAVGGTSGMFPDSNLYGGVTKPWHNSSPRSQAMEDFWKAHSSWLPTWQGDNAALIVDYVEFKSL